ncbi:MAG: alpha-1,2-fucosyltransferase [Spirochaetales bacterium]|nr:alpha-1,2-fucosyltransferase [Spirochaetales bacterium]
MIDALNADLIIYAQNTPRINSRKAAKRYGPHIGCMFYDNPEPSFEKIFDDLRRERSINFDWRENFNRIKDLNFSLGFSRPGTCIRRMYNRHLLKKYLEDEILPRRDYDYFIVTRSDIWFFEDFPFYEITSPDTLYSSATQSANGINNNVIVFGKNLLNPVLNYISLFLDGSMAQPGGALNEEMFFLRAMQLQNVSNTPVNNTWFISADSLEEYTTWGKIKYQDKHFFKKPHEFEAAKKNSRTAGLLSVKFTGGLGNRLFQYHTASYLAKRWRKKFVFDNAQITKNLHDTIRIETLFNHEIQEECHYDCVIEQDTLEKENWVSHVLSMQPGGNVLLKGHWQTFWPQHITIPELPETEPVFHKENAILFHVRCGDFLSGCRHHFINLENYYRTCLKEFKKTQDKNEFILFSDDIPWCRKNVHPGINFIYIREEPLHSLSLMMQCRGGAILSNSTFGLWGAYLCKLTSMQNKNYRVYCPSRFMSSQQLHEQTVGDAIFPEWVCRVEVD